MVIKKNNSTSTVIVIDCDVSRQYRYGNLKYDSIGTVIKRFEVNEVEEIDDASVIIRHLSVGITAETVLKPIVTT
jgi:hypothetical protein